MASGIEHLYSQIPALQRNQTIELMAKGRR